MHYYKFHIGDYAKETRHLTNVEDLAYRRLIDRYYDTEKPLTKDIEKLSRLINMTDNQEDIKRVLIDFFNETDQGYSHNHIERDLELYKGKSERARLNGKKGGRPKGETELKDLQNNVVPKDIGDQHFLYLMYDSSNNQLKVGETKDLIRRRYDIKRPTSNLLVSRFWLMEASMARELEGEIIRQFIDHRISGDWFVYSDDLEQNITNLVCKKTQKVCKKTKKENSRNPDERVSKANHKPLTTNQEPGTMGLSNRQSQEPTNQEPGTMGLSQESTTIEQLFELNPTSQLDTPDGDRETAPEKGTRHEGVMHELDELLKLNPINQRDTADGDRVLPLVPRRVIVEFNRAFPEIKYPISESPPVDLDWIWDKFKSYTRLYSYFQYCATHLETLQKMAGETHLFEFVITQSVCEQVCKLKRDENHAKTN